MELPIKRPDRLVPEYSLTGDLLSFRRCELQYRYYNGSSLPPSRPVQMWYGEFLHGVLEGAYGIWRASGGALPFPWPYTDFRDEDGPQRPQAPPPGLAAHDIRMLAWPIEEVLTHQGKRARSRRTRWAAYRRAERAVNMLGPHLFPLISDVEQKVIGTRLIPPAGGPHALRSERYALHGVIDVLTEVGLAGATPGNVIRDAVEAACPGLHGTFEVIVDYKGAARPPFGDEHWDLGEWQVQTYAWLRQRQQLARPVAAGILIYVNELAPSADEVADMKAAVAAGDTDVMPQRGDHDYYALQTWVPGTRARLSETLRFRRALRVVRVDEASVERATRAFDETVATIETRVVEEAGNGSIRQTWRPTCEHRKMCIACDFRFFCPAPALRGQDPIAADSGDDEL
jgi:hypothetical protein